MKIIPFAFAVAFLFSFCSPKVYDQLGFQKKEVQPDGNLSEWSNPLKYFDAKSKLNFTVTNDRKNLYVCIKASDDESQVKILRGGLDFSIDTASKRTFPITVTYPLPGTERIKQHDSKAERREEQSDISRKENIIQHCITMKLGGFKVPFADNVPLANPYGITPALGIDKNDVMVYELIIPFKTFYKEELSPADSNKVFTYQIKIRGLVMEQHANGSSGSNRGGGSPMGGGGGMGGGGMRGGGMGGGGMGGGGGRSGGASAVANNPLSETDVVQFKARFSYR